jgi:hypothetical protein
MLGESIGGGKAWTTDYSDGELVLDVLTSSIFEIFFFKAVQCFFISSL